MLRMGSAFSTAALQWQANVMSALFRRPSVMAQAFHNNRQLQQFVLTGVTPTGRVLGTGSYGSVEEVTYKHLPCAAKKLHEILIEASDCGVDGVIRKYLQECQLMSSLRHPNITLFLGLCYLPETQLPLLVMERLEMSLDDLLEHIPGLPISLKCSVLEDVASGLLYLHDRPSPIIHRDLTASNVLLTSSLVAKISDMGNSRIIDMRGGQMARTLSKLPGTLVYMPPEALDDRHHYGPSLDVFSYGHLALFTVIQTFPSDLLPSTFPNPDNLEDVRGRTEVGRRESYIEMLERKIADHPALIQLVKQCLHNVPDQRPSTDELLATLQRMKVEVEGEYGGSPIRLDMVRVRLSKEVKSNEQRIRELIQQQERHEAELLEMTREAEERDRHVQELQAEILTRDGHIQQKDQQLQQVDQQLQQKEDQIQQKENVIDEQIQHLQTQMEELHADLTLRETRLREKLQNKEAEISRLREEPWKEEMGRHDTELQEMTREAEERDRHVQKLQAEILTRDRLIQQKDQQLQQIEQQLQQKEEHIQQKDNVAVTGDEQIQYMQTQMEELRADLQQSETRLKKELQRKEDEMSEKEETEQDRHVQELQAEVLTRDGLIQQKDQQLQQIEQQLQQKEDQIQQKDNVAVTGNEKIQYMQTQMEELRADLQLSETQLKKELQRKEAEISRLKWKEETEQSRHVQELQAEILTRDGIIQQKDQQLQQIVQQLQQNKEHIQQKENVTVTGNEQIQSMQTQMEELRADLQLSETRLKKELQRKEAEISRLSGKEETEQDRHVQELQAEILTRDGIIQQKDQQLQQIEQQLQQKEDLIQQKENVAVTEDEQELRADLQLSETRLRKELQSKEAEISRLRMKEEMEQDRHFQELQTEILTRDGHIKQKDQQLQQVDQQLQQKEEQIQLKENTIVIKDELIQRLQTQMQELRADLQLREIQLSEELQSKEAEISRLREEPRKGEMVPLEFPLQLEWRCGPDMPFTVHGYVQSVVVQWTVYVGGGYSSMCEYVVVAFDITSGKWTTLPPYKTFFFTMTAINNQLVLVGGVDHGGDSKVLGVLSANNKQWTHPYPEMHTARSHCSAVVYNEWLVVAGGEAGGGHLSSVEVMNVDSKQWFAGSPTPAPWYSMRTAIVGDVCYFMGGCTLSSTGFVSAISKVYSLSLPSLTIRMNSYNACISEGQLLWKEISGLQTTRSTPLSISASLLAIGGRDNDEAVTAICLYQPGTGEWVNVGDLPAPKYNCTCAMITDRDVLVAGGYDDGSSFNRMDIALINC